MPVYTTVIFNPNTGQYQYQFVNQQYDFIMDISYDKESGKYQFSCSEEEARENWGRDDFDAKKMIREAEKEIKAAEKKKK